MQNIKRTPLYEKHLSLGARMVPFGGWDMPVQYAGIKAEHAAVRTNVGLFDVSHMGEFNISASSAANLIEFLNYLCANDATKLQVGQAQYSMFLNAQGGTIDDIIIYRLTEKEALIVVNAGNIEKDWAHVSAVAAEFDAVMVENLSDLYALLAIQGPKAEALANDLLDLNAAQLGYYQVAQSTIREHEVIVARTGYTGEDGFEIFILAQDAAWLWDTILEAGQAYHIQPTGLGARDTLRLEASMPLYGHELDDKTSPLEAGLGYFVAKKGPYIGSSYQSTLRKNGLSRKLVMLKIKGRGIAREGYPVFSKNGEQIGSVTSGTMSPHLGQAIAQAYVDIGHSKVGTTVKIQIRKRQVEADVVKRPFYKRKKRK